MQKGRRKRLRRDPLPENFASLEEFWEFWDTHSTSDYEDLMDDVDIQVEIQTEKVYFAVAKDLVAQIGIEARKQGVSLETLINLWLREKLIEVARK